MTDGNTALPAIEKDLEKSKILLIDLENCPHQIQQLQKSLIDYTQVVICYAHSTAKIPLDWLIPLNDTINNDRLKIYKMATVGKNSADFGICFFAGMLMQQLPEQSHFVIMSDDTDLDHVVNLLNSQNRTAERVGVRKEEKTSVHPISSSKVNKPEPSSIQVYCAHLVSYKENRPAKKETLLNSIKTKFKDTPDITNSLVSSLVKHGALVIKENKLIYNDKKITELSVQ
ncbi:MAG: PIN domain-containing protein [Psychromonas sp.]